MSKKIVVITGSPRKNGNSFAMTDSFIRAAEEKGLKEVAISDHGPSHLMYGLETDRLSRLEEEIRRARERRGVIILTDPDGPGAIIRQKIDRAVPGCKHAYIYKDRKAKFGHVGVEYASPEEIRQALAAVSRMETGPGEAAFSMADLVGLGLAGGPGAGEKRDLLARRLGLGQTNAKQFLRRLNSYGISRREFAEALEELEP